MACRRSALALTVALLTGAPQSALGQADDATNATIPARSLRGVCRSKNAQCGSNGLQTALCCGGLKCEAWLGTFEMRCVDKPSPAPSPQPRNTCREIGCGSQGNSRDECECIEECLLRGTCCSDFSSICKRPAPPPAPPPSPSPSPRPQQCRSKFSQCGADGRQTALCCGGLTCEPWNVKQPWSFQMRCVDKPSPSPSPPPSPQPAPAPVPDIPPYVEGNYYVYINKNAFSPYGAVDIDTNDNAPYGLTQSQCQDRCTADPECQCVTRQRSDGRCWKRKACEPSQWTSEYNGGFNVYMKRNSPSPVPPPQPAPAPAPVPDIPPYVEGNYYVYINKNAFSPYGAVDIDTNDNAPYGLSQSQCQDRCTADPECQCVTRQRSDGRCWKRKACVPSQWTSEYNDGFNVYMKLNYSPSPVPPPAPAPYNPPSQSSYLQWNFDSSYCMSVDNNVFENQQKVQLWKCAGGSGQYFQFDNTLNFANLLRPSAAPEYCVVVDGNKNENGAHIQLWKCDSNVLAQHWTREWTCPSDVPTYACAEPADVATRAARGDYALIRNAAFPDKCLIVDLAYIQEEQGRQLQLFSCDVAQQYETWKYGF